MKKPLLLCFILILGLAVVLPGCGSSKKSSSPPPAVKKICIIDYGEDIANLATFLEGEGYEVHSFKTSDLLTEPASTLSNYDLFLVTPNTGQWNGEQSSIEALKILDTGKPCLGMGGGGLGFFHNVTPPVSLRYTNGSHNDFCYRVAVVDATDPLWTGLNVTNGQIIEFYTDQTVNGYGVPIANLSASAEQFGTDNLEYPNPAADCAVLAREGRFFAWGFAGDPSLMTANGKTVFRNVIAMLL